uniref:Putative cell wall hydrolase n=1 Tax=viral metagenome TaxID=1070528 RepID=A0A6M3J0B1_9ZZZZ
MEQREREELCVALIVATEARGEPLRGQIAVAWTIKNRAAKPRWWGKTIIEVATKPGQYDGYTAAVKQGIFEALKIVNDQHLWVARGVLAGLIQEPEETDKATHYFNPKAVTHAPDWSKKLPFAGSIGNHDFYVEA